MTHTLSTITTGDGARIAYRFDGSPGKPVLVLANSIATTLHMWDADVGALSVHFRVLRYDMRGHGASSVPAGPYSIDRLGRDVIELLDALDVGRAHFLGLSLGGLVGQWLGIHAPERIERLVLSNTSPYLGPPAQWDDLIASVLRAEDNQAIAEMFLRNWFPGHMLQNRNPTVERFRAMVQTTSRQGLASTYAAIRDMDLRRTVALIPRSTLVIAGQHDTVTTASHGAQIAAAVPGAKLLVLPAVHLSNVEFPEEFVRAVLTFLLED